MYGKKTGDTLLKLNQILLYAQPLSSLTMLPILPKNYISVLDFESNP